MINLLMNSQDLDTLTKRLAYIKAVTSYTLLICNRPMNDVLESIHLLNLDPMFINLPVRYFTQVHIKSLEDKIANWD